MYHTLDTQKSMKPLLGHPVSKYRLRPCYHSMPICLVESVTPIPCSLKVFLTIAIKYGDMRQINNIINLLRWCVSFYHDTESDLTKKMRCVHSQPGLTHVMTLDTSIRHLHVCIITWCQDWRNSQVISKQMDHISYHYIIDIESISALRDITWWRISGARPEDRNSSDAFTPDTLPVFSTSQALNSSQYTRCSCSLNFNDSIAVWYWCTSWKVETISNSYLRHLYQSFCVGMS